MHALVRRGRIPLDHTGDRPATGLQKWERRAAYRTDHDRDQLSNESTQRGREYIEPPTVATESASEMYSLPGGETH